MSAFSEAALERKLSELSNSQQSVQTLSLWLIHHRKHSALIVSVWERELRKGEAPLRGGAFLGEAAVEGAGRPRGAAARGTGVGLRGPSSPEWRQGGEKGRARVPGESGAAGAGVSPWVSVCRECGLGGAVPLFFSPLPFLLPPSTSCLLGGRRLASFSYRMTKGSEERERRWHARDLNTGS